MLEIFIDWTFRILLNSFSTVSKTEILFYTDIFYLFYTDRYFIYFIIIIFIFIFFISSTFPLIFQSFFKSLRYRRLAGLLLKEKKHI